jgi:hypothetical protein
MIYLCDDILRYTQFFTHFKSLHSEFECIDLSKIHSNLLAKEAALIVEHHKHCCIFLGYVEPGWMLDPTSQVQLRELFRKFPVGIVVEFSESLPFSWKNEIDTIYTSKWVHKNAEPVVIHNGSPVHNKFEV